MAEAPRPRCMPVDKGNRALDLAQRPQRERQVGHRGDSGVLSEAEGQIVVAAGLEQGSARSRWLARSRYSPANQE